jgi:hypothetical protein
VYWVVEFTPELMEMPSHYDPAPKIFKLRPSPLVQPKKYQSAYGNKLAFLEHHMQTGLVCGGCFDKVDALTRLQK